MASRFRQLSLVLALLVAFSHTVLIAHAATHAKSAMHQCGLCLYQAQQSHGISPSSLYVPALAAQVYRGAQLPAVERVCRVAHAYFERAPPEVS